MTNHQEMSGSIASACVKPMQVSLASSNACFFPRPNGSPPFRELGGLQHENVTLLFAFRVDQPGWATRKPSPLLRPNYVHEGVFRLDPVAEHASRGPSIFAHAQSCRRQSRNGWGKGCNLVELCGCVLGVVVIHRSVGSRDRVNFTHITPEASHGQRLRLRWMADRTVHDRRRSSGDGTSSQGGGRRGKQLQGGVNDGAVEVMSDHDVNGCQECSRLRPIEADMQVVGLVEGWHLVCIQVESGIGRVLLDRQLEDAESTFRPTIPDRQVGLASFAACSDIPMFCWHPNIIVRKKGFLLCSSVCVLFYFRNPRLLSKLGPTHLDHIHRRFMTESIAQAIPIKMAQCRENALDASRLHVHHCSDLRVALRHRGHFGMAGTSKE
mmetsp:Transcript_179336/g.569032  ORF Transcript_179336/g.569032 Transcript_179336/m.569032 type:complete len:381 (+) Transcript_179336:286-1428(+)